MERVDKERYVTDCWTKRIYIKTKVGQTPTFLLYLIYDRT